MIRRFRDADAEAVSALIIRTLKISNAGDYSPAYLEDLIGRTRPSDIRKKAEWTHFYTVTENGRIIGCGAIGPYYGKTDESCLFSIFVDPDCQGRGFGRRIVETLERDPYFLRARRIEVPASVTAADFYRKLGYTYQKGGDQPDSEQLLRLEKLREPHI